MDLNKHQTAFGALIGFSVASLLFSAPWLKKLLKNKKTQNRTVKCLGFEMGGTTCKVGIGEKTLDPNGKVIAAKIITNFTINTTDNPEETVDSLLACVMNAYYEEVGIAHFGPLALDPEKPNYGSVTTTPKVGWQDFRALDIFRSKLPIRTKRITIETDVNAAALAEFYLGGHEVKQSLAYITVGTGIGVGLVVDGKPVHGLIHPEGGHTSVIPHEYDKDFKGTCPYHGKNCVEVIKFYDKKRVF